MTIAIEQKENLITELARRIDALAQARIAAVGGERFQLQGLMDKVRAGRVLIERLANPEEQTDTNALVDELAALLNHPDWTLTNYLAEQAEKKERFQQEQLQKLKGELDVQRKRITGLGAAVYRAIDVRAPIRKPHALFSRLAALVTDADRELRDQQVASFHKALTQLNDELKQLPATPEAVSEALYQTTRETEIFSQQAELLILQGQRDEYGRHRYSILLRTPGDQGAHGIIVQGSTTLVEQDRSLMTQAITKITQAVEKSNLRAARLQEEHEQTNEKASEPTDTEDATAQPIPAAFPMPEEESTETQRAALRRFVFGADKLPENQPLNFSGYVREIGDMMYRIFMPEESIFSISGGRS